MDQYMDVHSYFVENVPKSVYCKEAREWGRGCNSNDWRLWSPGNNNNNAVVVLQNDDVNPNGDNNDVRPDFSDPRR